VIYNLRFPGQYYDQETGLNYNYLRDLDPTTGRYVESDPIGLYDGGWSTYAYANGDPIIYVDPFGLCWVYSQSTGQLTHVDADGNVDYTANGGYSGYGSGLNNPAMQNVQNLGPIPQGSYTIGPWHQATSTGPGTMNLTPNAGTNTFGRNLFRIHGDNSAQNHTASNGCIIEPRNVRQQIADSNDTCLQVVP
jgi:RHS repeat-associated protein